MGRVCIMVLAVWLLAVRHVSAAGDVDQIEIDDSLPSYIKSPGVSGSISIVGSDTLNNLISLWAQGFRRHYPNVVIGVEGKGSGTAPPALIQGAAQLGPMSRPMKTEEVEKFETRLKYPPIAIGIALDALAVFVHKDNPLETLTLEEIDGLFSRTRRGGWFEDIKSWRQLGVSGPLADMPVSLYGRNSASGTYGFFKTNALFKGDFKDRVKEQPGSSSVVMAVAGDLAGIGYSGIGYATSDVKWVRLAANRFEPAYGPTAKNVLAEKYPLSRVLLIYVVKKPGQPLAPVVEQFLRFGLSREGQELVSQTGYIPLPASMAEKQLAKLVNP